MFSGMSVWGWAELQGSSPVQPEHLAVPSSPTSCEVYVHVSLFSDQVEREVAPTVLSTALFWGGLDLGGAGGQDNRTLTLGPSERDLPTGSTSKERPKPEEGQGRPGWGLGGGTNNSARPSRPTTGPSLHQEGQLPGPSDPWGLSRWKLSQDSPGPGPLAKPATGPAHC